MSLGYNRKHKARRKALDRAIPERIGIRAKIRSGDLPRLSMLNGPTGQRIWKSGWYLQTIERPSKIVPASLVRFRWPRLIYTQRLHLIEAAKAHVARQTERKKKIHAP